MPLVAMRASVREVLPWSYPSDQEMNDQDISIRSLRHERVYISVFVLACESGLNDRVPTFLTSSALR